LLTHQSGSQRTNRPRPRLGRAGEADRLNHRRGGFFPAPSFDYSPSQHAPPPTKLPPRATSRDTPPPLITSTRGTPADSSKHQFGTSKPQGGHPHHRATKTANNALTNRTKPESAKHVSHGWIRMLEGLAAVLGEGRRVAPPRETAAPRRGHERMA